MALATLLAEEEKEERPLRRRQRGPGDNTSHASARQPGNFDLTPSRLSLKLTMKRKSHVSCSAPWEA
ncbi:hypothetical protein EYF80_006016 [Liparis tanakae]|uniref:Uncharacterized protein n=1 Tax=Liparis tanakae TaxID=230148 RepID=A0A4Z2J0N9_9TELE|nr:hypothetical protein EYF80_006016 [Liparis tanakae]